MNPCPGYLLTKKTTIKIVAIIPMLWGWTFLMAQSSKPLEIRALHEEDKHILTHYNIPSSELDSLQAIQITMDLIQKLQKEGYLQAKLHGFYPKPEKFVAVVNTGSKVYKIDLGKGNLPDSLIRAIGLKPTIFKVRRFRYREIDKMMEKVVTYAEYNGYPFASLQLHNIDFSSSALKAELQYDPGLFITFDEIKIEGTEKVKESFLQNYLGIKPGAPFDQRLVDRIGNRLSRLNFLSLKEDPRVYFRNEKAQVVIPLVFQKNNRINGLISLLPNQGEGKGLMLAGNLDVGLNNLFRSGKSLFLHWERPQIASQELEINYGHPQLLGLPVKASLDFKLLKQDTTFLNREGEIKFTFINGKRSEIGIYTGFKAGSKLGAWDNVNGTFGNYQISRYGMEYNWSGLDNRLFPSKGFAFFIKGSAGKKQITGPLDEGGGNDWQMDFQGNFRQYHPVSKQLILYHRLKGGLLDHPHLFLNDLFRLGGFNNLRGFNENAFYASSFLLSNFECRFVFEKLNMASSYIFLFYDQGYFKQYLQGNNPYEDYPGGVGAGLNLITEAGTFNLAYAIGKSKLQPFAFSASKIHLGYKTKF